MIRCCVSAVLFLAAAALPLRAQDESERDRALEEMEARLQEQRATAVRARLVLYSDELEKLHAQYTALNETANAKAVKDEMDAVQLAMRRLANIARRQAEPPAEGELQKGEELSATGLAARRIDGIIKSFNAGKSSAKPGGGGATAANRTKTLKFEQSDRMSGYSDYGSRAYWKNEEAYCQWSLSNLPPGDYEVMFRYNAYDDTGGTAILKMGTGKPVEVPVPKAKKGEPKAQKLSAGTIITLKEPGADLRVENGGLLKGAESLWDLDAVIIQPAAKRP